MRSVAAATAFYLILCRKEGFLEPSFYNMGRSLSYKVFLAKFCTAQLLLAEDSEF